MQSLLLLPLQRSVKGIPKEDEQNLLERVSCKKCEMKISEHNSPVKRLTSFRAPDRLSALPEERNAKLRFDAGDDKFINGEYRVFTSGTITCAKSALNNDCSRVCLG